ncbi:MAG: FapA family protein [Lachnospiraceae bacterium]|nr:FapA family protein [Lachnospiraceae bacterium]
MALGAPTIRFKEDYSEAYMLVPPCAEDEVYTKEYLIDSLHAFGVKAGILEEVLEKICAEKLYNLEFLVAEGKTPYDGNDGYYDYYFEKEFDRKPVIRADGSVDYKNVKMFALVSEGETIAVYHPPTNGINGYNVRAEFQLAKRGKDLLPLKGQGFKKLDDGVTYVATTTGKITETNGRINILPVFEITGDVNLSTGNIDFTGDIIIHGNVLDGMEVKATGSITVDRTVEGALINGRKGVCLKGGILGHGTAKIVTKGDAILGFVEYCDIEAEGNVFAESLMNCKVYSGGTITVEGKKGCILGGESHGVKGIVAQDIGNQAGTKTKVSVGVHESVYKELKQAEKEMKENTEQLSKIEEGLLLFDTLSAQRGIDMSSDARRQLLVKEKVRLTGVIGGCKETITRCEYIISCSRNANIRVIKNVYPGVRAEIDGMLVDVMEEQRALEFRKLNNKVVMMALGHMGRESGTLNA